MHEGYGEFTSVFIRMVEMGYATGERQAGVA